MLLQIHRATGVSLDWLLLGKGQRFIVDKTASAFEEAEMEEISALARRTNRTLPEMIILLARAQASVMAVIENKE